MVRGRDRDVFYRHPFACSQLACGRLADLTETIVLPMNMAVNFDPGQISSSGGDIVWDGHTIAPQGTVVLGNQPGSAFNFDNLGHGH